MSRIKFCRCCKYNYKSSKEQIFLCFFNERKIFPDKKMQSGQKKCTNRQNEAPRHQCKQIDYRFHNPNDDENPCHLYPNGKRV